MAATEPSGASAVATPLCDRQAVQPTLAPPATAPCTATVVTTPEQAAQTLQRRAHERALALVAQRERALELLTAAAAALREEFAGVDVTLFGSLAWGTNHLGSDVDLALHGVPDAQWPALASWLEEALSALELPLELSRIEDLPVSLRQRIAQHGVRL